MGKVQLYPEIKRRFYLIVMDLVLISERIVTNCIAKLDNEATLGKNT